MSEDSDFARLQPRYEHLKRQFIETELELAVTFCEMATSTVDPEKAARNAANARKAYETVMHFLTNRELRSAEYREFAGKLSAVEQMLAKCERR